LRWFWGWPRAATVTPVAELEVAPTIWEKITDGIGEDGSVSLDTALAAFSYAIAPLPGAQVPAGEVEELPDASIAVAWVLARFDELTEEQQAAVGAALSVDEGRRSMITTIGAKLNRSLTMTTYVVVDQRMNEVAKAYTWVDPGPDCTANKGQVCQIHLTPKGAATSGAHLESILAHEVMHCYIFEILGVKAYDLPGWIGEGIPAWAGERIVGGSEASKAWWRDYLTKPGRSLFTRTYDAIGIFGHAEAHGVDLWHLTSPLVTAFDSEPAWDLLVGERDGMLDAWPSGLLRDPALGSGWDAAGPGITADKATPKALGTVGNGASVELTASKVAGALGTVELRADAVEITVEGHARIALSDGSNEVVHGSARWCLKESCACPSGADDMGSRIGGNVFATRLAGVGTGQVTAAGGRFTLVDSDFDDTLTWQTIHAFGAGNPQPGTVALDSGTYECSGDRLELSFPYPLGEVIAVYER
jgi:hypothetical protein